MSVWVLILWFSIGGSYGGTTNVDGFKTQSDCLRALSILKQDNRWSLSGWCIEKP